MAHIFVIGGASMDTLHIDSKVVKTIGGGGLYTSLAAAYCGADVSMFAPIPEPMPAELLPVSKRLKTWLGPVIPVEKLPHFEIEHLGDKANYLKTENGTEPELSPEQLPADLSEYDFVHITPLGDSNRQQQFIMACNARGARRISAGTYWCTLRDHPGIVRENMEMADVFFMNEAEACLLFGSMDQVKVAENKLLFVTMGAKGALVVQGISLTRIRAIDTKVVDPTGAGDSFCGAALAGLTSGLDLDLAAHRATEIAAIAISAIGPTALMRI